MVAEAAAASEEADLHASDPTRPPTTDSVSTIRRTVAVVRVTRSTRPTSPSSLSTVWSGSHTGVGAGVDGDRAGERLGRAVGHDVRRHQRLAEGVAAEVRPWYSASWLRWYCEVACWALSREFSDWSAAMSCCMARRERNQSPTAVTGRTTDEVPDSTGPKTDAHRARAGSTGEPGPGVVVEGHQGQAGQDQRDHPRAQTERSARWSNASGPGRGRR